MCRSIESAILGFVNCFINLMIVLKLDNIKIKYFIPFIVNLMLVQFSNILLWSQRKENNLKKNNINWLSTEFVLLILMAQPLMISYMTNSFIDEQNIKNMVYLISFFVFIQGIKRNHIFTKKYTELEQGKCLKWVESSKTGQNLFYLFDILPFLVAIFYTKNLNDRNIFINMSAILTFVYIIVSKFGYWWGSEWCAYGSAITGYISYYYMS